jgi:multiple sugar transport system substrate-binding protein
MFTSSISRRRFLQASAATAAGIAAGADLALPRHSDAANSKLTWLVRTGLQENTWEQKLVLPAMKKKGIDVNLIAVPGGNFDIKLYNMVAANTPPDIWSQWGPSDFVDYSWRGLTADIGPYLQKDMKDYADFYPGALDYGKWNGRQTGVPLMLGGTFTFYNLDHFDKAGVPYPPYSWDDKSWTWDEMVRRAKKLTHNINDPSKARYGVFMDLGCPEEFVWLFGGDVWDKSVYSGIGKPERSHWNTPQAIEAIQAWADLTFVNKVAPNQAQAVALSAQTDPFLTQRVSMHMTGIWGFWSYKDAPFRWAVAALPRAKTNKCGIYADPWLLSAKSKYPDAAWEMIKYLTTTAGARQYMRATNTPVPHSGLLSEWFRIFKTMRPEDVKLCYDGALKSGYLSIQNDLVAYDRIRSLIGNELNPVLNGQAKAKDVMAGLDSKLARLLRRIKPS